MKLFTEHIHTVSQVYHIYIIQLISKYWILVNNCNKVNLKLITHNITCYTFKYNLLLEKAVDVSISGTIFQGNFDIWREMCALKIKKYIVHNTEHNVTELDDMGFISIIERPTLYGRLTPKDQSIILQIRFKLQSIHLKNSLKYGSSSEGGRFMKNFRFDIICNITQEPQELQRFNCFICNSAVIKYQMLSKVN